MADNRRIVGPSSTGRGWQNVDPKGTTSQHRTQANAEKRAAADLRKAGGGERITRGRDGRIRDKDTIKLAPDPRATKG
jgi:hypothetical protein